MSYSPRGKVSPVWLTGFQHSLKLVFMVANRDTMFTTPC